MLDQHCSSRKILFFVQFILYFLFFMWESSHVNYKYISDDDMLSLMHGIDLFVKSPSLGNMIFVNSSIILWKFIQIFI
jgi:hypothetical protein